MAIIREQIAVILNQEMDRKHFLQYSLAAFLAAFGISGFISAILSSNKHSSTKTNTMTGYGSSRFGKSE